LQSDAGDFCESEKTFCCFSPAYGQYFGQISYQNIDNFARRKPPIIQDAQAAPFCRSAEGSIASAEGSIASKVVGMKPHSSTVQLAFLATFLILDRVVVADYIAINTGGQTHPDGSIPK
jgi:hypothetical protein